ncbi:uncharacterized protein LOC116028380 [Ipomoea triloba]|uniref:uncharacterized protein LOC116028380 n=1 Tax=Ipomoea triloba TaxID=35885 RepID=UPI00125E8AF6|nr:uncharacterized protein LOC116028380 [Ipomoea triloba]
MERKQGFLSALKEEVIRGFSPARSRSRSRATSPARSGSTRSGLLWRRRSINSSSRFVSNPEVLVARSGSLRQPGETLTPLMEGPDPDGDVTGEPKRVGSGIGQWVKGQLTRTPSVALNSYSRRSDLRLLLGVMGAPLAPVHVSTSDPLPLLSIKDIPIETSSAQYILQQYIAASGGQKLQNSVKNAYAMGKLKMLSYEIETPTKIVKSRNGARAPESGGFVIWQMNPDMWYMELAIGGSKIHAGCNGKIVWRHTPWLGAHPAKGPVRPLRRALQGLDPKTTATMFANARCIGEKNINGEDCFILKLSADPQTLKARSEGSAEIIRHVLFGYFSQKSGLLIHIEDSHLTRIQSNGEDAVYWETTISSFLDNYHPVEGIMIAHSGRSTVTLFRFGDMAMSHTKTTMEEAWTIEEVAFNIPGLSLDCFIPPADLRSRSLNESFELPQNESDKNSIAIAAHCAKVAAVEETCDGSVDNMMLKVKL